MSRPVAAMLVTRYLILRTLQSTASRTATPRPSTVRSAAPQRQSCDQDEGSGSDRAHPPKGVRLAPTHADKAQCVAWPFQGHALFEGLDDDLIAAAKGVGGRMWEAHADLPGRAHGHLVGRRRQHGR